METLAIKGTFDPLQESSKKLELLEEKAREMQESIRYAGLLQRSILPNENLFKESFADAFVLFKPKDIVGGDFYWISQHGADIYFAVGDCTGHGVPGAMLNIAGNTLLKQIIQKEGVSDPAEIIEQLDIELAALFNDNLTKGVTSDGMDIVFCKFNLEEKKGYYCGAGRPLIRMRNGALTEFKRSPFSVGYNPFGAKRFETIDFELKDEDTFYLFSDGYTDQFGGDNVKKFNRKRLRSLFQNISDMKMDQQKKELAMTLRNWMGTHDQIDDVCVLGVKI